MIRFGMTQQREIYAEKYLRRREEGRRELVKIAMATRISVGRV
jgi:hypothetical protein